MKKAWRRQARHADNNGQHTEFQVGDLVCLIQQQHKSKIQGRWYPYYRIVEKNTQVILCIKKQLDGTVTKAHAEHLCLTQLDDNTNG